MTKQKEELENKRQEILDYKGLLYEQGKPLENIVIRSFRLIGFHAERYTEDDMEHDIVLQSDEGRIICEVEGKDNQPISIENLDQLSRVIDEDFRIHGSYSEGILVGNPYRLSPLDQRKDPFTEKVKISAARKKFGLLTTAELFRVVTKILSNPEDEGIKLEIRKRLFNLDGTEISFDI